MALLCHHFQSQCNRALCRIRDHIASLLHWPGVKLQTPVVDANVCLWRWGGRVAGLRLCHWRCAALDRAKSGRSDRLRPGTRSEEHTSELQSLMRISYAVFCLKKQI